MKKRTKIKDPALSAERGEQRLKLTRGFTLIELLVVIAIIGILSTLLLANFNAARERARDAQRKHDIDQIVKALEIYKNDQVIPSYPATDSFPTCGSALQNGGQTYMAKVPCDPLNTGSYVYTYTRGADDVLTYTIVACLENAADKDKDTINTCSQGYSYTRTNP